MLSKEEQRLARAIGRRIRELREERGWDQVDLEAAIDSKVGRTTISNFETGVRLPSLRTLLCVAEAFDVELAVLLLDRHAGLQHRVAEAALRARQTKLLKVAELLDVVE